MWSYVILAALAWAVGWSNGRASMQREISAASGAMRRLFTGKD